MRYYITLVFTLLWTGMTFAQSEPKLSIFSYNPLYYNPAYAGVFDGLKVTGIYSTQMVGFEGAPKTLFFSAHSNVIARELGVGVDITSDKIGPVVNNKVVGNVAYYIQLDEELNLTLGAKAGMNMFSIDYNLLSIENPEEYGLDSGRVTQNSPIIGAGMYLSNEKFFVGFSVPNMLKTKFYNESKTTVASTKPNSYVSAGYKFEVDDEVFIQPNILSNITPGAPVSHLLSVNMDYQKTMFGSLNYQPNASLGFLFGYRFENNISVGYAYDYSLLQYTSSNAGSHTFYINFLIDELISSPHYGFGTF